MLCPMLCRILACVFLVASPALAQDTKVKDGEPAPAKEPAAKAARPSAHETTAAAAAYLLAHQEREAEWPYEGVYRVQGEIPIGYRIGGTAICAMALIHSHGFAENAAAKESIDRAREFVVKGIAERLMSIDDYDAGYDVRGWGYTYGLWFLLECKRAGLIPGSEQEAAEKAIAFYLDGIHRTEIPDAGGWNYARPPGKDKPAPPSPFMTAPTLIVLFQAAAAGYTVDDGIVKRALGALERSRAPTGAVAYSGERVGPRDGTPGSVGRMLSTECALFLAGRSTSQNVRGALDAFIVHWEWLEKRRAKNGTHEGPYAVAPYYFYFAHYWAAQAIELLPENERAEYRRRVHDLVFQTRAEDGTWNDRVFPRSACYGTAMCSLALSMPDMPRPAAWPTSQKPAATP
jgi:hypothetical protein